MTEVGKTYHLFIVQRALNTQFNSYSTKAAGKSLLTFDEEQHKVHCAKVTVVVI